MGVVCGFPPALLKLREYSICPYGGVKPLVCSDHHLLLLLFVWSCCCCLLLLTAGPLGSAGAVCGGELLVEPGEVPTTEELLPVPRYPPLL